MPTRSPVLELRHHATLRPVRPTDRLMTVSTGPAGDAIALWAGLADPEALRPTFTDPGGATFPHSRTARPVTVRLTTQSTDGYAAVEAEVGIAHLMAQPLPGTRFLIVGSRCGWTGGHPERNAVIVDADGHRLTEATLGDGIEHVRTTASGQVWVGYFDEGVYGNLGWGGPNATPIGHPGIRRFTPDLAPDWQFPYRHEAGVVDDCYALNVAGEVAWACYYSDFPIVRLENDTVTWWRNTVTGAQCIVADGERCALVGDRRDRARLRIGSLRDGTFQPEVTKRLMLPDGGELPPATTIVGCGPELNVFVGTTWLRADPLSTG